MPTLSGPVALAPTGSTGNNSHSAVKISEAVEEVGVQVVVEAVGGTPTVTFKLQGSNDGGVNWFDLIMLPSDNETAAVSKTVTALGAYMSYVAQAHTRFAKHVRLVTSANTNVTYRGELYALDRG